MCEAHICETISKAVPGAKTVTASHKRCEASLLSDARIDKEALKNAIAATGYTCCSVESAPYEKKGLFAG